MPRPIRHESESRRREFARLVAWGTPLVDAARRAKVDPWRALRLLDSPEMRDLMRAARPEVEAVDARDELLEA